MSGFNVRDRLGIQEPSKKNKIVTDPIQVSNLSSVVVVDGAVGDVHSFVLTGTHS